MKKLKRWIVPVELIVYGEDESDAASYAVEALAYMLDADGIAGVNDEIDLDAIEEDVLV